MIRKITRQDILAAAKNTSIPTAWSSCQRVPTPAQRKHMTTISRGIDRLRSIACAYSTLRSSKVLEPRFYIAGINRLRWGKINSLMGKFAAKEAAAKALGCGIV
jgi:hypothetical protein